MKTTTKDSLRFRISLAVTSVFILAGVIGAMYRYGWRDTVPFICWIVTYGWIGHKTGGSQDLPWRPWLRKELPAATAGAVVMFLVYWMLNGPPAWWR